MGAITEALLIMGMAFIMSKAALARRRRKQEEQRQQESGDGQ
jgi:hypothetical protein